MAPRQPRKPPSATPPSRDRSRTRPVVPRVDLNSLKGKGLVYDRLIIGDGTPTTRAGRRAAKQVQFQTAKSVAARGMSWDTAMAMQASKQGDDSELLPYQPTPTINPPRPRTLAAGYDADTQVLRVRFRDGTPWEYYNVEKREWNNFKRVKSPGRYINRVLNTHEYARGDF